MTRALQTCDRCGGKTRHADGRCSRCRRGLPVVSFVREIRDVRAATVRELKAAQPVGHLVHVDFRGRGA